MALVFKDGFESGIGDFYVETTAGNASVVNTSSPGARTGANYCRINHNGQNDGDLSGRVEVGSARYNNADVKFFRISYYIPSALTNGASGNWTIGQIYNVRESSANGYAWEFNSQIRMNTVTSTTFKITYLIGSHNYSTGQSIRSAHDLGTFNKNKWLDIVIEQPITSSSSGYSKVWVGEKGQPLVQKVDYQGPSGYRHQTGWFKCGLYGTNSNSSSVIYIDEMYVGANNSSVAEVRPDGGSTPPPDPDPEPPTGSGVRINAGGSAYTTVGGDAFVADAYFTGGTVETTSSAIANTTEDALYQNGRLSPSGGTPFSYTITGLTGNQDVKLHFCEYVYTSVADGLMDVKINGTTVLNDYSILSDTPNQNTRFYAVVKTFTNIAPNNGNILIEFVPLPGDRAKVAAIEVIEVDGGTTPPPTGNVTIKTLGNNTFLGVVSATTKRVEPGATVADQPNEQFQLVPSGSNYKIKSVSDGYLRVDSTDFMSYADATEANASLFTITDEQGAKKIFAVGLAKYLRLRPTDLMIVAVGNPPHETPELFEITEV